MKRLLIIGHRWPESQSSAAGTRMRQLIAQFKALPAAIHFASTAAPNSFSDDLKDTATSRTQIEANDSSFDQYLEELNPDIVVFDRFMTEEMFGWRVRDICPGSLQVLDTEDLHFLRQARRKKAGDKRDLEITDLQNRLSKREVASIYRCDLSLIISEFEMQLLIENFQIPPSILCYWPIFTPEISARDKENTRPFDKREGFVFIGNFHHRPNVDCVQFLKSEIWPQIHRQSPAVTCHIYGAYCPEHIKQMHKPSDNFLVHGRIGEADTAFQNHRVLLAPLRFGAGLKGKVLKAMQNGMPFVTTSTGAEGIAKAENWPGSVSDNTATNIENSLALHNNPALWKQQQARGWQLLDQKFNSQKFPVNLQKKLLDLHEHLQSHRQQNFVGQLLNHHQHESTKFMARWIEEKNKYV